MVFKELNAEIDFVGIIDMMPQVDRKKWDISKKLADLLATGLFSNGDGIDQKIGYCSQNSDVWSYLDQFIKISKTKSLILHFVSHGNEDGLAIKNSGQPFIAWTEFKNKLVTLNKTMGGNLIINLTSCFGFHGVKMVSANDKDLPFYGLIGSKEKISFTDAIRINDLLYKGMAEGKEIPAVIIKIIKFYNRKIVYGRTGQTQQQRLKTGNDLSL